MTEETTYDVWEDNIVQLALNFMQDAHRHHALKPDKVLGGQRRKYSGAPYEVHPIQVAKMVAKSIHGDAITVAVALLHDVVEDTTRNAGHIRGFFGPHVGNDTALEIMLGVLECTDISQPEDGNRKTRKDIDKEHAWKATAARQTVKLADIKSNLPSIVKNDPGFARKWVAEKADMLPGLTAGDPKLYSDVERMIKAFYDREEVKDPDWELV